MAEYVKKYATEDALRQQDDEVSTSSESSMSDFSEDEAKVCLTKKMSNLHIKTRPKFPAKQCN